MKATDTKVYVETFVEAVGEYYPGVDCHTDGDPCVYNDIVWDGASVSEADLQAYIDSDLAAWDELQ